MPRWNSVTHSWRIKNLEDVSQMFGEGRNRGQGQGNRKRGKEKGKRTIEQGGSFSLGDYACLCSKHQMKHIGRRQRDLNSKYQQLSTKCDWTGA